MRNIEIVIETGYCPTQDDETDIYINYSEVPIVGKPVSDYKRMTFSCDYADDHKCRITEECPIYQAAPVVRRL